MAKSKDVVRQYSGFEELRGTPESVFGPFTNAAICFSVIFGCFIIFLTQLLNNL